MKEQETMSQSTPASVKGIGSLVAELRRNGDDYEFYPTTQEIVNAVAPYFGGDVLDVGCGDGGFFRKYDVWSESVGETTDRLHISNRFGIERSLTLAARLPEDVFLLGTDFYAQTLIDKKVDCIFSNPPYSDFERWSEKLIREGNAKTIVLVLPKRWQNSDAIKTALSKRNMEAQVVGRFDFKDGERVARGEVDAIIIRGKSDKYGREEATDPFDAWFDETFKINAEKSGYKYDSEYIWRSDKVNRINSLVEGSNVAETLVNLYHADMERLLATYRSIENIDGEVFRELKIDLGNVKACLKQKIDGLKHIYWDRLFQCYSTLTSRLTSASVNKIIGRLHDNTCIDFTYENICQLTLWVIRNSNKMFDDQLKSFYLELATPENITRYKSNRHWTDDEWRYLNEAKTWGGHWDAEKIKERLHHAVLEYRIVVQKYQNFDSYYNCPDNDVLAFLRDICKIAKCLGLSCDVNQIPESKYEIDQSAQWNWSNFDLHYSDGRTLANVKLYKNGNRHLRFDKEFMRRLNIEAGRLFGWLREPKDAAEEIGVTAKEAEAAWRCNAHFSLDSGANLLGLSVDIAKESEVTP